jgi:hypothetical protein
VENNKINGLINESNMLTPYGKFITNTSREYEITDIKFILSMMDAFGYGVNIESEICKNLMLSYIFKSDNINYALKPKFIKGNADFLVLMIYIPEVLFSLINTDYIINYIINNLDKINTKNINNLIDNIINRFTDNFYKYFNFMDIQQSKFYINIIKEYYKYKIIFKLIIKKNPPIPKYSSTEINYFNKLTDYDKFCYILLKNYSSNIYIKISNTDYYINYFNRDINYLYELNYFENLKSKKRIYTNFVNKDLLNSIIFAYNVSTTKRLENIIWINKSVINLLEKFYFKNKTKQINKIINIEYLKNVYGLEHKEILKKIDKIITNI